MKATDWLRAKGRELLCIKDTHESIATGVAVGMFFGFIPLLGMKTLLSLAVTRLLRGNLIAAAIAVTLHDLLLPVAPLLLRWEYDLGYWLLSRPHEFPPHLELAHHTPRVWLHWSDLLTVGRPLLVGSILFAIPIALATYFLFRGWLSRSRNGQ